MSSVKEWASAAEERGGGMGPSTCTRVAEIMSGRAICQQGLATTCKDPAHNGYTGGAGRRIVWRMSPYERRRGGNAPPGGFRGRPGAGNARSGQRGSGCSVAMTVGTQPDAELGLAGPASWRRGGANSTASGRRVRQHRSFAPWRKARPEKWRAEPRPEPDSGNPTVRDRRGALRNVATWEPGVRPGAKATEQPPDPGWCARSISIPDNRTVRGGGERKPDQSGQHAPRGPGASRRSYSDRVDWRWRGLESGEPTVRRGVGWLGRAMWGRSGAARGGGGV